MLLQLDLMMKEEIELIKPGSDKRGSLTKEETTEGTIDQAIEEIMASEEVDLETEEDMETEVTDSVETKVTDSAVIVETDSGTEEVTDSVVIAGTDSVTEIDSVKAVNAKNQT